MVNKLLANNISLKVEKKNLLRPVSLSFSEGMLYGVLGPNGAGKSSLLNILSGLSLPSSGEILWNQKDILLLSAKQRSRIITLVPQNSYIMFDFSVWDFVAMGLYAHKISEKDPQAHDIVYKRLIEMSLANKKDSSILSLSAGELKRAYLARALVCDSKVVILDEPSTFLDIKHQQILWKLLKKITEEGKVVIIASHDLNMSKHYCDHIILLKEGKYLSKEITPTLTNQVLKEVFEVDENLNTPMIDAGVF
ncbi:MAG: ATP-binding cassette domain-containing protein [Chlamydiales bacterium]|nr:ABC transporter ATP-binding protein [Chlamydiales bacterium]NCF70979.1 ATP-binding cassette domain-containing protein [Chlamydiales bacterium]